VESVSTVWFDEAEHDLAEESGMSPETGEKIDMLQKIISECRPLDRALLVLYPDDRSYREIASVLGLTETNVATKLNRLKEHLRQQLTAKA
jgi:RNA polymerase sigma-70 factor, ECF subfamily